MREAMRRVYHIVVHSQLVKTTYLKPIRWKTFWRDLLVIQAGFCLMGFSIAAMIRANLGTSAWAVLEVALSKIIGITPGTVTVLLGFLVLSGALILRERIGWGTLANILSIGPWIDAALWLIPPVYGPLWLQIPMLLGGILGMGLGSAIYRFWLFGISRGRAIYGGRLIKQSGDSLRCPSKAAGIKLWF
jgi:hypothetical protein